MAEAMTAPPAGRARGAAERRFYVGMAIAMIVIIFLGFAPSFYLTGMVTSPPGAPPLDATLILHGVVLTAWMLMFLTQASLVAVGRRDLHMKLGIAGMVLAVLAAVMMYAAARHLVMEGHSPPFATPLMWSSLPLLALPVFVLFIALAWTYRGKAQFHKRYMLLATFCLIEPGLGRIPVFPPTVTGNQTSAVLALLLMLVPLALWDWRSTGRVHKVTMFGAGLLAADIAIRYAIWDTAGWARVAAFVLGVPAG